MQKKKIIFLLVLLIVVSLLLPNKVMAANFTCNALGDDIKIDNQLANIVRYVILIMQILVPVLLVILGLIDFVKAIASQKDDEIKKGQQIFLKRVIAGILVFFVIAIVKFVISVVAGSSEGGVMNCANCFIKGPESSDCG